MQRPTSPSEPVSLEFSWELGPMTYWNDLDDVYWVHHPFTIFSPVEKLKFPQLREYPIVRHFYNLLYLDIVGSIPMIKWNKSKFTKPFSHRFQSFPRCSNICFTLPFSKMGLLNFIGPYLARIRMSAGAQPVGSDWKACITVYIYIHTRIFRNVMYVIS